jgi:3',5'-cyclic AMP phosphodiesterase CpdA
MKIIHLSDTHMLPPGEQLFGVDPEKRLAACVEHVNQHHGDADLCVISGDLANQGQVEAYEHLALLLDPLKPPLRLLLGNHDRRRNFIQVFGDLPRDDQGYVQSILPGPEINLIFLDSKDNRPGHQGRLGPRRLAWLQEQMAALSGPMALFIHHPWFPLGIPSVDCIGLDHSQDLQGLLLKNLPRLAHLGFGHYHRFISGSWHGVSFHTINSVAHQIALEVHHPRRVAGSHEEPAYAVVNLEKTGVRIQQCHFLRDTYDFWIDH